MNKVKITNSRLFRAMKWLTENVTDMPENWLDTMTSREIVNMHILRSNTYKVEYSRGGHTAWWANCTYEEASRRVGAVVRMAEDLGGVSYLSVIRENDFENMTREFDVPAWF